MKKPILTTLLISLVSFAFSQTDSTASDSVQVVETEKKMPDNGLELPSYKRDIGFDIVPIFTGGQANFLYRRYSGAYIKRARLDLSMGTTINSVSESGYFNLLLAVGKENRIQAKHIQPYLGQEVFARAAMSEFFNAIGIGFNAAGGVFYEPFDHFAISAEVRSTVEYSIEYGANVTNQHGETPIHKINFDLLGGYFIYAIYRF